MQLPNKKNGRGKGMILKMSVEDGFLRVDATGEFSLHEAQQTFLEILEAVARAKVKKVLMDGRRLNGEPTIMERFYYGEFAANSVASFFSRGVSPATKFAYVLKEPVLDPGRFGETVAVNRGMLAKVCEDPEEAFAWLEVPRESRDKSKPSG